MTKKVTMGTNLPSPRQRPKERVNKEEEVVEEEVVVPRPRQRLKQKRQKKHCLASLTRLGVCVLHVVARHSHIA